MELQSVADETAPKSAAALRALRVFSGLADPDLEAVFAEITVKRVRKGAGLIVAKEYANCVGIVWSGAIDLVVAPPPRRPVRLMRMRRGAILGSIPGFDGARFGDALRLRAHAASSVLKIDADRFRQLRCAMPDLAEAMFQEASLMASDYAARVFEFSALSVMERLQVELLRLAQHTMEGEPRLAIDPAPTHQDLADQVGCTRENMTRTLSALSAAGVIKFADGALEILDAEALLARDRQATDRLKLRSEHSAR